jgi:hypothetical protein
MTLQQRDGEKECSAGNGGADVVRHNSSVTRRNVGSNQINVAAPTAQPPPLG